MDRFVIHGGTPLSGTIRVSGAKNAALPCLAASLLTDEPLILEDIPAVRDIRTTCSLLETLGVEMVDGPPSEKRERPLSIRARNISSVEAPWELVRTMRASTLILGPLVARCGEARVSLPGGCAIGARPIDLHLKGLEKLGAEITPSTAWSSPARGGLRGARIVLRPHHRHRHRRPVDGGDAGRRRNVIEELRRASRRFRSRGLADEDGREDRRRGHLYDSRAGRGEAGRRDAPDYSRPH